MACVESKYRLQRTEESTMCRHTINLFSEEISRLRALQECRCIFVWCLKSKFLTQNVTIFQLNIKMRLYSCNTVLIHVNISKNIHFYLVWCLVIWKRSDHTWKSDCNFTKTCLINIFCWSHVCRRGWKRSWMTGWNQRRISWWVEPTKLLLSLQ